MTRYQLAFAPFLNKYINDELSKHYGGRRVAGVLPGLQNQCGALIPSRMGSIPICSRQNAGMIFQTRSRADQFSAAPALLPFFSPLQVC